MKKLLPALLLLCSAIPSGLSASTPESRPMLVEGQTWWLTSSLYNYQDRRQYEMGVRVGTETEIEGELWHTIDCIYTAQNYIDQGRWEFSEEVTTVAYMKEDNGEVFSFAGPGSHNPIFGKWDWLEPEVPSKIYDFNHEIGESILMGSAWDRYPHSITLLEITTIENSGHDYKVYKFDDKGYQLECIEGIGTTGIPFFNPFGEFIAALGRYEVPLLRYVTDANDNVIFEGEGGFRAWDKDAVEDIFVEETGAYRWYNLQGIAVDSPDAPGVYIRCSPKGNDKIIIR